MRVLVCGGRDFTDVPLLWRTLDDLHRKHRIERIIEGASDDVTGPYVGADYWAHEWAIARFVDTTRYRAEWKRLGRAAGPIRNARMLEEAKPDLVVAFAGGNGTANMIGKAKGAKAKGTAIEIIEVKGREV